MKSVCEFQDEKIKIERSARVLPKSPRSKKKLKKSREAFKTSALHHVFNYCRYIVLYCFISQKSGESDFRGRTDECKENYEVM